MLSSCITALYVAPSWKKFILNDKWCGTHTGPLAAPAYLKYAVLQYFYNIWSSGYNLTRCTWYDFCSLGISVSLLTEMEHSVQHSACFLASAAVSLCLQSTLVIWSSCSITPDRARHRMALKWIQTLIVSLSSVDFPQGAVAGFFKVIKCWS